MAVSKLNPVSGGVTQKVQEFTSTGTFTVPTNCSAVEVFMVGGGAGGGGVYYTAGQGSGGGGGGGAVLKRNLTVTPGTSYTVTIGAGGAGATVSGTAGADGGDSSFGSLLTVPGGGGGGNHTTAGGYTAARSRGTIGGAASYNDANNSQSGTGASFSLIAGIGNTSFSVPPAIFSSTTNPLYGGYIVAGYESKTIPGAGIEGFGGGGWGGRQTGETGTTVSIHGGAVGSGTNSQGQTGTTNKGGGGGGGSSNSGSTRNGGNGGSGYALITYWS